MQGTSFQRENRGIEAIIWIIKAQKCKPFCSTIYVLQAKIHLEFSLCVTGLPCFMNYHFSMFLPDFPKVESN